MTFHFFASKPCFTIWFRFWLVFIIHEVVDGIGDNGLIFLDRFIAERREIINETFNFLSYYLSENSRCRRLLSYKMRLILDAHVLH